MISIVHPAVARFSFLFVCLLSSVICKSEQAVKSCEIASQQIEDGNRYFVKDQFTQANKSFTKGILIYNESNCDDKELLSNLYMSKAHIMLLSLRSDSAAYYIDLAQKTVLSTDDVNDEIRLNTAIGMMMNQANAHDKALFHFKEAYQLLEKLPNELFTPKLKAISNYNLGLTYNYLNEHQYATKYLTSAIKHAKSIDFIHLLIDVHGVLARELKVQKNEAWKAHLDTALSLSVESGNDLKTANAYLFLADYSFETNDFNQTVAYAQQALGFLNDSTHNYLKPSIYRLLSESYLAQSDFKSAAESLQRQMKYASFYDSVNNATIALKFEEKLKLEKALAEERGNLLILKKQNQFWIFSLITLFLLSSLIIGYRFYKTRSAKWLSAIQVLSPLNKGTVLQPPIDPLFSVWLEMSDLIQNEKLFLNKSLSLDDLAKRLGTNVNYISKAINCYAGVNFKSYLNKLRTAYVQELILKQDSIETINFAALSEMAGFNSARTFYRAFREMTGTTPKLWSQKHNAH